ncbi:MAG: hypothetical protein HQK54_04420, partial [Oligoflexales bacterium]|nr:hypothetical protein [Oligoflexales bacterium]
MIGYIFTLLTLISLSVLSACGPSKDPYSDVTEDPPIANTTPIKTNKNDIKFISLSLMNEALEGFINYEKRLSTKPLAGLLMATGQTSTSYAAVIKDKQCEKSTGYKTDIPTATTITANGTYKICVKLSKDMTASVYGETRETFVRDITPPAPPSSIGFASTYSNTAAPLLSWVDGTDAIGFKTHNVKACTSDDCNTGCTTEPITSKTTSATLSGLRDATVYYGCVQSVDAVGNTSSWISSVASIIVDTTLPNAPTNLAWKERSPSGPSNVTATWTKSTSDDVVSQYVAYYTDPACEKDMITAFEKEITDESDSYVGEDKITYYFDVTIIDKADNEVYSECSQAMTIDSSLLPPKATELAWSQSSPYAGLNVTATWKKSTATNIVSQTLTYYSDSSCITQVIDSIEKDKDSQSDTLTGVDGATYYFQIAATNDLEYTTFSECSSEMLLDNTAPVAASSPAWAETSPSNNVNVTATWKKSTSDDIIGQTIQYYSDIFCTVQTGSAVSLSISDQSAVFSGTNGNTYYFKVSSTDKASTVVSSDCSSGMAIDTAAPDPPPSNPYWTGGTYSQSRTITANWTLGGAGPQDAVAHELWFYTNSGCSNLYGSIVTGIGAVESSRSHTVTSDGTYYFIVKNKDNASNKSSSNCSAGITVDTEDPDPPASPAFSATLSNSASQTVTWTNGGDENFSTHDLKACTSNDCSTGCGSTVQKASSPGTVEGLADGSTYYACIRSVDLSGRTSAWIASSSTIRIDLTPPSGTISMAETTAGYSTTRAPALTLTRDADVTHYQLCSDTATFGNDCSGILRAWSSYTANPSAYEFDSDGSKSIYVQLKDEAGNIGATVNSNSLIIDTINPASPQAVTVPSYINTNFEITFTPGTEANPSLFNIKACTSDNCSTGCVGATTTASSPGTILATALTNGTSYYGCVQATDAVGHISSFAPSSAVVLYDITPPSGTISLAETVAGYSNTTSPAITLTRDADAAYYQLCSNTATNGNNCSGVLRAWAAYSSTPAAYDFGSDGSKNIYVQFKDNAGNIGATVASNSLVVDTINPASFQAVSVPSYINTNFEITFTPGTEANPSLFNIKACTSDDCSTGCVGATTTASSPGTILATALTNGTSYYGCVQATDAVGHTSSFAPSSAVVLYDITPPSGTISLAETVAGYSNTTSPAITLTRDADAAYYQLCSNTATNGNNCSGVLRAWAAYSSTPAAYDFGSDGSKNIYVQFKDNAGNIGATVASNSLVVDTINPASFQAVSVPSYINTNFEITFTPGTEANPSLFNIKACTSDNCSTGCVGATTTASSPGTILATALTNGTSYYGCVQATDAVGHISSFAPSSAVVLYDITPPS